MFCHIKPKVYLYFVIFCCISIANIASCIDLECKTSRKPDKCTIEAVPGDFSLQEVEIVNSNADGVKKIEIEDVHLGRLPKSLLKYQNLLRLELSNCHIFSLNGVDKFQLLEDLSLEKNNISEIREGQLPLPGLVELDIGENEINTIDERAFKDCTKLEQLDLSYNKIQHLEPATFRSGLDSLQTIELQSNLIENVEGIFNNLPSLLRLDLSSNKIKRITAETFKDSTGIFKLKLVNNQIDTIDPSAFDSQKHLQSLYLSDNRLKIFNFNVISEYLIHLTLRGNLLEQLGITTDLSSARNLYFDASNNRLQEFTIQKEIPLKKIDVSHNNIKRFTANLTKLEFLHLDNNDLNDNVLETLIEAKNLTFVTLNDTGIDETQFRQVIHALPKLKHFDVSYNFKLGNLDLAKIEAPVQLLDTLEMNFCGVTSINVDLLREKFPNLRKFGLLGNPIKYKEVKRINSFIRNESV